MGNLCFKAQDATDENMPGEPKESSPVIIVQTVPQVETVPELPQTANKVVISNDDIDGEEDSYEMLPTSAPADNLFPNDETRSFVKTNSNVSLQMEDMQDINLNTSDNSDGEQNEEKDQVANTFESTAENLEHLVETLDFRRSQLTEFDDNSSTNAADEDDRSDIETYGQESNPFEGDSKREHEVINEYRAFDDDEEVPQTLAPKVKKEEPREINAEAVNSGTVKSFAAAAKGGLSSNQEVTETETAHVQRRRRSNAAGQ
jgi:hypothetical protein